MNPSACPAAKLPVTKTWLRQLTLGVTLIGHCSYRGVVELIRDVLGARISEGIALIPLCATTA